MQESSGWAGRPAGPFLSVVSPPGAAAAYDDGVELLLDLAERQVALAVTEGDTYAEVLVVPKPGRDARCGGPFVLLQFPSRFAGITC